MKPKNSLKTYWRPYNVSYTVGSSLFEHSFPDVMALNFASGEITWRELFRSVPVFVWCCSPLFLFFFSCTLFTLEEGFVRLCKWLKHHFLSLTRSHLCAVFHPFFLWLFLLWQNQLIAQLSFRSRIKGLVFRFFALQAFSFLSLIMRNLQNH